MSSFGKVISYTPLGLWWRVAKKVTAYADSYLKGASGSGMTNRDKELSDTSLSNTQFLNEEEYQRKIDFYERFESPEAQVRQYREAGLNPALMFGNGASVSASGGIGSAGSAPAQSAGVPDFLGGLMSAFTKMHQIEVDKKLESRRLDLQEKQQSWMERYYNSLSEGQEQKNSVFFQAFDVDQMLKQTLMDKNLSDIDRNAKLNELADAQIANFNALTATEPFKRRMYDANIKLADAQTALTGVQKAIQEAASNYSDEYYGAIAKLQSLAAVEADWTHNNIFEKTHQKMFDAAVSELNSVILKAGYDAKAFTYFDKFSKKDWGNVIAGLIGTGIGTAGHIAGSMIRSAGRAANAVAPVLWTPGMQYQFYGSTGSRFDTTL